MGVAYGSTLVGVWLFVFGLAAVVSGGGCDRPTTGASPAATAAPTRTWDLSADQDVARVGWPAQVTDDIWFIDGPVTVEMALPDDRRGVYTFHRAQLRRSGGKLVNIYMMFPSESVEATYSRAISLADEWGLDERRDRLRRWYEWRGEPPPGTGRERSEHVQGRGVPATVSVWPSHERAAPSYAALSIGFPQNDPSRRGTTTQAR